MEVPNDHDRSVEIKALGKTGRWRIGDTLFISILRNFLKQEKRNGTVDRGRMWEPKVFVWLGFKSWKKRKIDTAEDRIMSGLMPLSKRNWVCSSAQGNVGIGQDQS